MRRFSKIFAWTTLFFVAGAVLFFTKAAALPYKVAWPVLLLSLATFLSRRRELLPFGFAFLFSAAGDAVGARGLFIPQMAFFALAHVAYVCWFLPRARHRLRAVSLAVTVPLLVFLSPPSSPRPRFRPNASASPSTGWSSLQCFIAHSSTTGHAPPDSSVRPCCSSFPTR